MFGCRRFTTSRREVQTMASHLQATAGSISRAQQKAFPTAHVCAPVDDTAPSTVSSMNTVVASAISLPTGCGMLAAAQQSASSLQALLREEQLQQQQHQHQQQQHPPGDDRLQPAAARPASACSSCSTWEAATDRARSWYGQRSWTRVAGSGTSAANPRGPSPPGTSQPAASAAAGASGALDAVDAAPAAPPQAALPATSQAQAWKFSVMCYNILADTYAQYFAPKLYRDVPRPYLDWHHRLHLLMEEIRYWAPDVVCMQEVQHYHELEPKMRDAGYEGRFMRRTGRRRDGCATFWRADRLRACAIQRLDFAPLGLEDNVAMLLSLAPCCEAEVAGPGAAAGGLDIATAEALSSVRLLVATTHITFDPAKGDVKLGQVRTLLSQAAGLAANPQPEDLEALAQQGHSHGHSHSHGQHQEHDSQHHQNHQHQTTHLHSGGGRCSHDGECYRQQHNHQHQQHTHRQQPSRAQCQSQALTRDSQQPPQQLQRAQEDWQGQGQATVMPAGAGAASTAAAPATPAASEPFSFVPPPSSTSATASKSGFWSFSDPVEGRWRKPRLTPRGSSASGEGGGGGEAAVTTAEAAQQFGQQLEQAGRQHQQRRGQPPLQTLTIITGDFNSTAGSPLYQFVARGSLDLSRTNRKKLSGQLHGVCHTQYKPVSEVKQLHAQLSAASTAAVGSSGVAAATSAAAGAAISTGGTAGGKAGDAASAGDSPATVVAAGASAPGTPPSTPAMSRLASAAMDTAAAAISACTAKAVAAISHPALSTPAAKAAAAVKVLDSFLSSTSLRSSGAERWSEKELRSAMGDQYDPAAVQAVSSAGMNAFAPGRVLSYPRLQFSLAQQQQEQHQPTLSASGASAPQLATADCGRDSGDVSPQDAEAMATNQPLQAPKLGRQHHPPAINNRVSLAGSVGGSAAASGSYRRSLDLNAADGMLQSGAGAEAAAAAAAAAPSAAHPDFPTGALVVRHPLNLKSSYVEVARAEPSFTSIHSGFMGTVDFIWYTQEPILQQQQQPRVYVGAAGAPAPLPASAPAAAAAVATDAPRGGPDPGPAAVGTPVPGCEQTLPQSLAQGEGEGCSPWCSCAAASAAPAAGEAVGDGAAPARPRFQLVPVAVLQPPDLELLPHGLPAAGWGSDHISVMTEFELRPV